MHRFDVIIVGGGAAGFFCAINAAQKNPKLKIAILERGSSVLEKVRISGGGRCNVTHSCFVANDLVKFYPRGEKELRGPFHAFGANDTIEWFKDQGVALKTEADGRMFPTTDSSQTIIDCFLSATAKYNIQVLTAQSVQSLFKKDDLWKVETKNDQYICEKLVIAAGSNPKLWQMLEEFDHTIVPAVPSLFTFNIKDSRIKELPGIASETEVKVLGTKLSSSGPLLITHWGMSGPAILKLSAWGARILAEKNYQFKIQVNWLAGQDRDEVEKIIMGLKLSNAKKNVRSHSPFPFAGRLWDSLTDASGIAADCKWADLNKIQTTALLNELTSGEYQVNGKSTFKEEFVTAGGVNLKEVNFKTMESKKHENLYFAGEILNIDAITGGFNFQNAWTTAFIAANALA